MEYHGSTQAAVFEEIAERIRSNSRHVLEASARDRKPPREAAMDLSISRIRNAMGTRRWSIY
jgi:glutamate dehydrogenase (NAD(P)+)